MEQPDLFAAPAQPALVTAGVDEAGRGPLAGAVYAAAVILDPARPIDGLADSKVLKAATREALALEIQAHALAWCVASASVAEIDSLNILRATLLAMRRAVEGLSTAPQLALVDGNQAPKLGCTVQTVIKGDALVPAISAASILAKTARDADLLRLHALYPQYAFDQHKGYGTALHLQMLREHGPCVEHRRSFAPIKAFGLVS
ncbi:ribonuclease HII [Achromobacter sp. SIMBA_011]|uniref:Ribonuclease HII n=1 Tax=Achromobacter dolens TaxID=1287738 RepID=A0A6S7D871_9BURK|nr:MULTISPECIES: ribonuclease HII [Achromobacter]MBQ2647204.1 ribonuclease HII [Achromobacter sp.]MCZ8439485.1 ribonuclease HII [Achromobacter xylosoxidans]OAS95107.1 ribonuclease HII [Achromobacter xylosoxidans]CAB3680118.1 Ribonuclease HII [Achromobacter dolens]CAB3823199.1 Ribonuclease HII [Achromobacter dolens]